MTSILLDRKFNEGIPALLPKDVKVAHKTGWITSVRHDSGMVILPTTAVRTDHPVQRMAIR